jgi:cytochrome c-type biogenesis protein CcmH/NrfG
MKTLGNISGMVSTATCRGVFAGLAIALLLPSTIVRAAGSAPVSQPRQATPAARTAESVYNDGLALKGANRWSDAETAFREATTLKPDFPEAWSELGHALRKRGRYEDSVSAYQEALRLRPNFPQALEYLGETYVDMGQRPEAKRMLDRLRPLDPTLAAQLAQVMAGGASEY